MARKPWSATLVFDDPELERAFEGQHASRHRSLDATGALAVAILVLAIYLVATLNLTNLEWFASAEEHKLLLAYAFAEAIPGVLVATLPAHVYTAHRKRLHQAMQLVTAALYPAFGYHRAQNIAGDHTRRGVRAVVVLSRLFIMSRACVACFQLLGRPMLLRHRLPLLPFWLASALSSNADYCRAGDLTPASRRALLDVYAVGARVAGLGLGRWPAEGQADAVYACSVVINWVFLSFGVLVPSIYLYVIETRQRSSFLARRGLQTAQSGLSHSLDRNMLLLPALLGLAWLACMALAALPRNPFSSLGQRWNAVLLQQPAVQLHW
ncbi:hypothetical protein F751_5217 [Auxenochlorella protothecoides]|uniref:Uncharacterized protein n=1 Tax=Auxenochlorella protothecoides TaxID=3075 RepID=A0A087SQV2_AUXPR|nr:hypothetical protein F751_5217 [Auxenochlorella protothecoides]KFM28106.1 hypothetical protein F751_5217 [Auxenochlorella protothecoides]RMZ54226.1 hypothetical protein APUTEX25_000577 [Auxenochlorella protothecoides]|eukprot:RMZ54226.1 hypothetical protein APUTEX25_000577 [Auxenochlorella protothecoides]